ncbi:Potassium channel AKT6 [Linum perenne]
MAVYQNGLIHEEENEEDDDVLFQVESALELALDLSDPLRPILVAARSGDAESLARILDDNNGSIDEPLEDGDTALHLACLYGYSSCVRVLLERGANIEVKDEDGAIPLHDACAGGYTEIVQLLLNHANGSNAAKRMLETIDDEGDTELAKNCLCCTRKNFCNIELLVSSSNFLSRVSVANTVILFLEQPLHHAARGEHSEIVSLLLASGASVTRTNSYGKIPSELADPDTEARRILEACSLTQ